MLGHGEAGFARTPVSLFLVSVCGAASFLGGLTRDRHLYALRWDKGIQLWRALSCHLVFTTVPEVFFGLLIIYAFRNFERMFGSLKFASSLVFFVTTSTLFQVACLVFTSGRAVASSGPYSIIFALFIYFLFDIPSSLGVKVFGVPIGQKGVMYLLGLQLAFSSMPLWSSVTASCIGLLCGCLHRSTRLPFHRLRLPRSLTRLFAPLLHLFSRPARRRVGRPQADSDRANYQLLASQGSAAALEENVAALVSMGFPENRVRQVLETTGNNVERASNILLDG